MTLGNSETSAAKPETYTPFVEILRNYSIKRDEAEAAADYLMLIRVRKQRADLQKAIEDFYG